MVFPVKTAKIPITLPSVLLALQFGGWCFSVVLLGTAEMDVLPIILVTARITYALFAAKIKYFLVYL